MAITVSVKWGKKKFDDIKVDPAGSSDAFRATLETLTGERAPVPLARLLVLAIRDVVRSRNARWPLMPSCGARWAATLHLVDQRQLAAFC